MYQSFFSYGLTKPYPYPWFTWLTVIGGIIALAIFSVLNLAANGYELTTQYVTDLKGTESPAKPAWYQKRPWSLASKVNTFCQDQVFSIGSRTLIPSKYIAIRHADDTSEFYTNNTILKYEILGIASTVENQSIPKASFTYRSDILQDCFFHELHMSRRQYLSKFKQLQAIVVCTIHDAESGLPTTIKIASSYNADNWEQDPFHSFLESQPKPDTRAASWWGALLLWNANFYGCLPWTVSLNMLMDLPDSSYWLWIDQSEVYKSEVFSSVSTKALSKRLRDRSKSRYEWVDKWSLDFGNSILGNYRCKGSFPTCIDTGDTHSIPQLTLFWDSMAKIFYYFVMIDLGQSTDANVLANPSLFVNFLNATQHSIGTRKLGVLKCASQSWYADPRIVKIRGHYPFNDTDPLKFYEWHESEIPTVSPAVINTAYICQIPKRKPIGSLIVNIIVADLVFLQTLWMVFTWIVKFILEYQDPQANDCLGCAKSTTDEQQSRDSIELVSSDDNELHEDANDPGQISSSPLSEAPAAPTSLVSGSPQAATERNGDPTVNLLGEV